MRLRSLFRSRLALRIGLVGFAQLAAVLAGFFALVTWNRPAPRAPVLPTALALAARLAAQGNDAEGIQAELAAARRDGADAAILDEEDRLIASSQGAEALRCPRPFGGPPHHPPHGPPPFAGRDPFPPPCAVVPIDLPGGVGELHFLARPPPAPPSLAPQIVPLVLFVVVVSSLLLAWSLARPLRRLSETARAFGAGDLEARVGSTSSDELGEVARAFDEMAARVSDLLRAEKELIANVSHELRTPLARIRVAVDLATEGDAQVTREALVDIADDLDELERLLADILTAARLDLDRDGSRGLPPLRTEDVDTVALIEAAAVRFRAAHPERTLDVELETDLPGLRGDAMMLRRALENLLTNAHKYTERADEPVRLVARDTGTDSKREITIDVVDRGVGITEEDMPRLFRPFFRSDKSRARATGGLGLGLALAKRIVEAHGGTIALTSVAGAGTQARIVLPGPRG